MCAVRGPPAAKIRRRRAILWIILPPEARPTPFFSVPAPLCLRRQGMFRACGHDFLLQRRKRKQKGDKGKPFRSGFPFINPSYRPRGGCGPLLGIPRSLRAVLVPPSRRQPVPAAAVGAYRKHAGGMFLASDRSGCVARREVVGSVSYFVPAAAVMVAPDS